MKLHFILSCLVFLGLGDCMYIPRPEPKFRRRQPRLRRGPLPQLVPPPPLPPPPPQPPYLPPVYQPPPTYEAPVYNTAPVSYSVPNPAAAVPQYVSSPYTNTPLSGFPYIGAQTPSDIEPPVALLESSPVPYIEHNGPAPHLFRPSPIEYGGWKPTFGPYGPAIPPFPFSDIIHIRPGIPNNSFDLTFGYNPSYTTGNPYGYFGGSGSPYTQFNPYAPGSGFAAGPAFQNRGQYIPTFYTSYPNYNNYAKIRRN